jgi:hypothetical protein
MSHANCPHAAQDRAVKIILYQCEAQAHFFAHLAFSSTDGRKRVTREELAELMDNPEDAIRSANASGRPPPLSPPSPEFIV